MKFISSTRKIGLIATKLNHMYLVRSKKTQTIKWLENNDLVREWNGGHKLTARGSLWVSILIREYDSNGIPYGSIKELYHVL